MCNLGNFVKIVEVDEKDALIGYRAWKKYKGKLKSLFSHGLKTSWESGEVVQSDRTPRRRNTNGLWCWNEENKENPTYKQFTRGKIKIWGTIIMHKRGYRAQFAKIVKVFPKVAKKRKLVGV